MSPAVVIVHGFGEHSGRYEELAGAIAASGREVWAADLHGHGLSPGRGADVGGLKRALSDMDHMVSLATAGPGGGPVFLYGHSMGGAFAAAYAVSRPGRLSGVVLSAPAVHLALRPRWQSLAAQVLAAVAPRAGLGRVMAHGLSRDPAAVEAFASDPLVWHGRAPARTAVAMYEAGRAAFAGAPRLALPLLVVHGEDDPIVPVASSRSLFDVVGSTDKQLVTFAGALHEPHHELGRQEVFGTLVRWLGSH